MNQVQNKETIGRFVQAVSGRAKTPELLKEYIDDPGLTAHILMFESAFPQYEFIAEEIVGEGDKVVVRAVVKGVHHGDLPGIPATGKSVETVGLVMYRLHAGKISEHWMGFDQMDLARQLEAMPS